MPKKFKKNEICTMLLTDNSKLVRNPHRTAEATAPIRLQNGNMESEHFWKIFPVWMRQGSTHTLVEVIYSSNREHRHGLKSDSEQGYYSYIWPLAIPENEEIHDDFDDLFTYHSIDYRGMGLMLAGRTFRRRDFSRAVEKNLCFMAEVTELHAAGVLYKEQAE